MFFGNILLFNFFFKKDEPLTKLEPDIAEDNIAKIFFDILFSKIIGIDSVFVFLGLVS